MAWPFLFLNVCGACVRCGGGGSRVDMKESQKSPVLIVRSYIGEVSTQWLQSSASHLKLKTIIPILVVSDFLWIQHPLSQIYSTVHPLAIVHTGIPPLHGCAAKFWSMSKTDFGFIEDAHYSGDVHLNWDISQDGRNHMRTDCQHNMQEFCSWMSKSNPGLGRQHKVSAIMEGAT